jgi:hypothetical protein
MTTAEGVYLLCATASLIVAAMLLRKYLRVRTRLVLLSFICFTGLAANNVLVYIDLVLHTGVDLSVYRGAVGAVAMLVMLHGLVWETHK